MKSPQTIVALTAATLLLVVLFVLNLAMGSVSIPLADVWAVLTGNVTGEASDTWRFIIIESRLPQAIMALMGGAALAVSGLLLQTTFRNPLAGPDVFGINSGAALAVAVVMLGMGGSLSAGSLSLAGYAAVLFSALVGALAVTALISALSAVVRSSTMLLIIGLMIGYLANSAITLLNFFATSEGVKSYTVWGMGSFGNVSLASIPVAAVVIGLFLLAALAFVKPLNAFLLGELYAENLGYDTRKLRLLLLLVTGVLTATVTAFCGPIAFIGLATPHIARLFVTTENHRVLLPSTMLLGSVIALLCNWLCALPTQNGIIPLGAVTPLLGAPVIIFVLLKRR